MFFALFAVSLSAEQCEFKEPNSVSDAVAKVSDQCRGFATIFGKNATSEFPNVTQLKETGNFKSALPYVYGIAGFILPAAAIMVLLILFFLFGQIFAICPCCYAKTNKKITCSRSIFHITSAVLVFVAIALFFFSASQLTKGLNEIATIPANINTTFDTFFSTVDTTITSATDLVSTTLNDATTNFQKFLNYLSDTLNKAKTAAEGVESHLNSAKDKGAGKIKDAGNQFDTIVDSMGCYQSDEIKIGSKTGKIETRMEEIIDKIGQFSTKFDDFDAMRKSLNDTLTSLTSNVKTQVDKFTDEDLPVLIDPLKESASGLTNTTDYLEDFLKLAQKYSNIVIYCVVGFLAAIGILYTCIYFCTCCCARCLAGSICSFGLLITILLGIPFIAFSVVFFLLYDGCPHIDPTIDEIGRVVLGDSVNASNALVCSADLQDKSLYNLLGLKSMFDYKDIIDKLNDSLSGQLDSFDPGASLDALDNITSIDIDNQFTDDYLAGFNLNETKDKINKLNKDVCPGIDETKRKGLLDQITAIEGGFETIQTDIDKARDNATEASGYAKTMKPMVDETMEKSSTIIVTFTNGTYKIISDGINNLDCTLLCSIYAPAKNALCVHIVNGSSFWLLSAIIMVIGLAAMTISICMRRKGMLPPKVEDDDEEEEEEDDEFSLKDKHRHHRHHRRN